MSWRVATSLLELRGEIDAHWPDRDKRSDGTIGDLAHQNTKSDHNPNEAGVVRALDVDVDGIAADSLAEHVRQLGDGADPHTSHIHLSVSREAAGYDASGGWDVDGMPMVVARRPASTGGGLPRHPRGARALRLTDPFTRGTDVQDVQRWVGATADGIFGRDTEAAVKRWQTRMGLEADGIVGPLTWASMRA